MRVTILGTFVAALVGCTSIPEQIQGSYPDTTPARVDPGAYGSRVRWGGVIVDATAESLIAIAERALDGEPCAEAWKTPSVAPPPP